MTKIWAMRKREILVTLKRLQDLAREWTCEKKRKGLKKDMEVMSLVAGNSSGAVCGQRWSMGHGGKGGLQRKVLNYTYLSLTLMKL